MLTNGSRIAVYVHGMVVGTCLLGLAAPLAQAAPSNDGSIFHDDFDGNSLDASKWKLSWATEGTGSGGVTVSGGIATFTSDLTHTRYYNQPNALNFSALPGEWVASVRFSVSSLSQQDDPPRQPVLLRGTDRNDDWQGSAMGFDLRILDSILGSQYFDLGWYGEDDSGNRNAIRFSTGYDRNTMWTITMHRKPDGMVDLYFNDEANPISTQALIGGINPTYLFFGDTSSSSALTVAYDSISIGAIPEPSGMLALGAGALALSRYRRRKNA